MGPRERKREKARKRTNDESMLDVVAEAVFGAPEVVTIALQEKHVLGRRRTGRGKEVEPHLQQHHALECGDGEPNQKPRKWAGQEVEEQPADKGLESGLLVVTGVPGTGR